MPPPPHPAGNGHGRHDPAQPAGPPEPEARPGLAALVAEAEALREVLRDAHGRAGRLCAALKQHRRQSHAVRSTLQSLRQLQRLDIDL